MTGVQLGGIDPSILRELSGVYKPFVKALKELVSNAFDADADHVHITIADDFASITITDDGEGMTPFEFRNDLPGLVVEVVVGLEKEHTKGVCGLVVKALAFSRLLDTVAVWKSSRLVLGCFIGCLRLRKHQRQSN